MPAGMNPMNTIPNRWNDGHTLCLALLFFMAAARQLVRS